jgi:hypothetical protein
MNSQVYPPATAQCSVQLYHSCYRSECRDLTTMATRTATEVESAAKRVKVMVDQVDVKGVPTTFQVRPPCGHMALQLCGLCERAIAMARAPRLGE